MRSDPVRFGADEQREAAEHDERAEDARRRDPFAQPNRSQHRPRDEDRDRREQQTVRERREEISADGDQTEDGTTEPRLASTERIHL